jgi:hypothetical protein
MLGAISLTAHPEMGITPVAEAGSSRASDIERYRGQHRPVQSARSIATGSIRTARITGRAAIAIIASEGNAITPTSPHRPCGLGAVMPEEETESPAEVRSQRRPFLPNVDE